LGATPIPHCTSRKEKKRKEKKRKEKKRKEKFSLFSNQLPSGASHWTSGEQNAMGLSEGVWCQC